MSRTAHPLAGKTALITGGSRGLGRAMVLRLAGDGAQVVFSYRSNSAAAEAVVAAAEQLAGPGRALAVQADGSTTAGVGQLFAQLDRLLPGEGPQLDILIANAGLMSHAPLEETDEAEFDRVFDLNVKGVFFTVQGAVSRMRDGGRIVLLGTGLTRFAMAQYLTYSAAKGAIDTMAKVLAQQLGPRGITVNTLAPGAIDTDMNPWLRTDDGIQAMSSITALNRVGHAEDIADVAGWLVSDDARWVTAQRIEASGGMKL